MYISSLKLQQISLITKFIDTYNSSNSRYLKTGFQVLLCSRQAESNLLFLHVKDDSWNRSTGFSAYKIISYKSLNCYSFCKIQFTFSIPQRKRIFFYPSSLVRILFLIFYNIFSDKIVFHPYVRDAFKVFYPLLTQEYKQRNH